MPQSLKASTKMKKTPIGEIPVDWGLIRLRKCLVEPIKNGYSPNCPDEATGKWTLSLAAATPSGFNPEALKPAPLDDSRVDAAQLTNGDIVVSRSKNREIVR